MMYDRSGNDIFSQTWRSIRNKIRGDGEQARPIVRCTKSFIFGIMGKYRPGPNELGFPMESGLAIPFTELIPADRNLIFPCDFIPDKFSFAGTSVKESPHLDFAVRYLSEDKFDYRETEYYKLALRGRLNFPCSGRFAAELRAQQFIEIIDKIKNEGFRPDKYGAISVVECSSGEVIIVNGKHRVAALLALNMEKFPVAFCFADEIRAHYQASLRRTWPKNLYKRSLNVYERIGKPLLKNGKKVNDIKKMLNQLGNKHKWGPIPYYEFLEWNTYDDSLPFYQRLGMVLQKNKSFDGKRVLDMSHDTAFYSLTLAKRGAEVKAAGLAPDFCDVVRNICELYETPLSVHKKRDINSILPDESSACYDVALMFSTLRPLIEQNGIGKAGDLLKHVSEVADVLFIDFPLENPAKNLETKGDNPRYSCISFIKSNTAYQNVEYIGDVSQTKKKEIGVFYCTH
jgi:hypothetical protein